MSHYRSPKTIVYDSPERGCGDADSPGERRTTVRRLPKSSVDGSPGAQGALPVGAGKGKRNCAAVAKGSNQRNGPAFGDNQDINTVLMSKFRSRGSGEAPERAQKNTAPVKAALATEISARTATVDQSPRTKPSEAAGEELGQELLHAVFNGSPDRRVSELVVRDQRGGQHQDLPSPSSSDRLYPDLQTMMDRAKLLVKDKSLGKLRNVRDEYKGKSRVDSRKSFELNQSSQLYSYSTIPVESRPTERHILQDPQRLSSILPSLQSHDQTVSTIG